MTVAKKFVFSIARFYVMALNILAATNLILSLGDKVSVQGVLALGGYFATYARSSIFMREFFFSSLIFKKKRQIF